MFVIVAAMVDCVVVVRVMIVAFGLVSVAMGDG